MKALPNNTVKLLNGDTCGTGTIVFQDSERAIILTAASIAGTRIDKKLSVIAYMPGEDFQAATDAKVIAGGFKNRSNLDYAFLESKPFEHAIATPLFDEDEVSPIDHVYGSHPGHLATTYQGAFWRSHNEHLNADSWAPGIRRGQAGAGVLNPERFAICGMMLWGDDQFGTSIASEEILRSLKEESVKMAVEIPKHFELACDKPQSCEEGFFGSNEEVPNEAFCKPSFRHESLKGGDDESLKAELEEFIKKANRCERFMSMSLDVLAATNEHGITAIDHLVSSGFDTEDYIELLRDNWTIGKKLFPLIARAAR